MNRFHTVRVTPASHTSEVDDGDIIFTPTEIPNACPRNGSSMLRQIKYYDLDDARADIELLFFSNSADMEAAGAAATKFTFAGGNTTDTLVEQAAPLGNILIDTLGGPAGTAVSSQDGVYYSALNYINNTIQVVNNLSFPVNAGNLTSIGTSTPSSIFFAGIATATRTYTASGLIFEFVFEY
tara:strand:+ start:246 stop:791 length:546 start_codon:yes stop_codon:yes gene_type:complete